MKNLLFEIRYQNGNNEFQCFESMNDLLEWFEVSYQLGNRIRGSVTEIISHS